MSEQKISYGYMAVLNSEIDDDIIDDLYDNNMGLSYDSKVIYFQAFEKDCYEFELIVGKLPGKSDFKKICKKLKIDIDESNIKQFFSYFYNGCDSPMAMITIDYFNGAK